MMDSTACPCCDGRDFFTVLEFADIPASGIYRLSDSEPLPAHTLAFEACENCGLLRNSNFSSPPDYSGKPRGTAKQLPVYQESLFSMIEGAADRDDLIVEIGSNDGTFLELLQQRGYSNICGVEPSESLVKVSRDRGLRVMQGYFDQGMAARLLDSYGPVKLVICRHTLEHVPCPANFVAAIRALLAPGNGFVLLEVPESTVIFEHMNFAELWDEHLYYFTPDTLRLLLERAGLAVSSESVFPHLDTQNLIVSASLNEPEKSLQEGGKGGGEAQAWKELARKFRIYSDRIRERLMSSPRPVYLIGASHPQCNFANYLDIGAAIDFMVDDDAEKVGKLPPVRSCSAKIISTESFLDCAREGTLLLTGFGYPGWMRRISAGAQEHGMTIIDPYEHSRLNNLERP